MGKLHNFYFHHSDTRLIVVLLALAAISVGIMTLTPGDGNGPMSDNDTTAMATKQRRFRPHRHPYPALQDSYQQEEGIQEEHFYFDPNTADSTTLLRLGLQPWQVRNIYKFRAKGGIYRRPTDFAKLYGLTQKQYRELAPYIHISDDYKPASELPEVRQMTVRDTVFHPTKLKEHECIVLNTADTNALKRIPGIGSYYAKQIVNYGQRLGGYVSVDQLDEIDDLPTEAKRFLVIRHAQPRRMNINQLTLNQLKRHPYMGFFRAKYIDEFRRIHGSIHSLEELRFSPDFNEEAIRKLAPYVEF